MNEKNKTNEEAEEQSDAATYALDHSDFASEQREHHLLPMSMALANLVEMLLVYGDGPFQRALDYNAHIPISAGLEEALTKHVGLFRHQALGLMNMLKGSYTARICPGGDAESGHVPHLVFDLSALGEDHLNSLEEEDPDRWDEALSDPLAFAWPWLGQVDREDELAEQAEEAALDKQELVATLTGLAPVLTAEQTRDQIEALRDENHVIRVVVPVPFCRMDENNEFAKLEDFVEDFIGGDDLLLTQVSFKPVGVRGPEHVLVEVCAVADFIDEINNFGEMTSAQDEDDTD